MSGSHSSEGGGRDFKMPARHGKHDEAEFDITAMVDLVFMMNIYFLVTFIGSAMGDLDLPAANHCQALDAETATIVNVVSGSQFQSVDVYVGEKKAGSVLSDPDRQTEAIAAAVEEGVGQGKTAVLFKADKSVRLREMRRLARAANLEGVSLHFAVMERDVELEK